MPKIAGVELTTNNLASQSADRAGHNDVIDFNLMPGTAPVLAIELDPDESVVTEAGALLAKPPHITMETIFGDGSQRQQGLFSKFLTAGKRLLTGESLTMTVFTNSGSGKQVVHLAPPYPGTVMPINLAEHGGELICQSGSFFAAARGVAISIEFQKKLSTGFFGGEGFIMQRLSGDGWAFVHFGGDALSFNLAAGETLEVESGCIAAFERSVTYDLAYVGSIKSGIFGGEGLFMTTLTGPGKVWIQSMPFNKLAAAIASRMPAKGGMAGGFMAGSMLGGGDSDWGGDGGDGGGE